MNHSEKEGPLPSVRIAEWKVTPDEARRDALRGVEAALEDVRKSPKVKAYLGLTACGAMADSPRLADAAAAAKNLYESLKADDLVIFYNRLVDLKGLLTRE